MKFWKLVKAILIPPAALTGIIVVILGVAWLITDQGAGDALLMIAGLGVWAGVSTIIYQASV